MNLLAPNQDPRIPASLLLMTLAWSHREEMRRRTQVEQNSIGESWNAKNEPDYYEEPERWDGMS